MLTITCNRSTNQESPRASKGHTMSIMSDTTTDSQSTPIYLLLTLKLFRPSDNYRLVGLFYSMCRQQREEERLSKSKKYVFISASFLGKLRFHSLTSVFPRTTFTPSPRNALSTRIYYDSAVSSTALYLSIKCGDPIFYEHLWNVYF